MYVLSYLFDFVADSPLETMEWVKALTPRKKAEGGRIRTNVLEKGYLIKEGGGVRTRKRRWFTLTDDTLYYFKVFVCVYDVCVCVCD